MNSSTVFRKVVLLSITVVFLLGVPGLIIAQEQEQEEEKDVYVLEEVVVTATKTGETDLQETPLAITTFDSEKLTSGGVNHLQDIEMKTPGLQVRRFGASANPYIRGIGSAFVFSGAGESVGVYLDDVYSSRAKGLKTGLLDLERIEVLRGPQGTIFGRNTVVGAIRVITRNPSDEFSGFARAEYGTGNRYMIEGGIGGPIIEGKLGFRLAYQYHDLEGYTDNLTTGGFVDGLISQVGRAKLLFTPTDRISVLITGSNFDNENSGFYVTFTEHDDIIAAGGRPVNGWDNMATNFFGDETRTEKMYSVSADVKIRLPRDLTLRSITAYSEHREHWPFQDIDGTTLRMYETEGDIAIDLVTQEFQINGSGGSLDWVGGFFYLTEDEAHETLYKQMTYIPMGAVLYMDISNEMSGWAAYLSGTYAFSDRLSLSGGIRYTEEERTVALDNRVDFDIGHLYGMDPDILWTPVMTNAANIDHSWSDVSPQLSLNYRWSDDIFLYGSVSNGFKAGGIQGTSLSPGKEIFDSEHVWSYEIGVKTDWYDKRLRVNTAFYYMDYRDFQATIQDPETGLGIVGNAPATTIYGAEVEVLARISGLSLGTTLSLNSAEYDDYTGPGIFGGFEDYSGNRLNSAPRYTVNAFAGYSFSVKKSGFITFYVDANWRGDSYSHPSNVDWLRFDALNLFNGQVSFETTDGKWYVDVFGRNLGDEQYYGTLQAHPLVGIKPVDVPLEQYRPEPRVFGIRVGFRF